MRDREMVPEEGRNTGSDFLRERFRRGDFDRPPLSGPAYDAWRELEEANRFRTAPPLSDGDEPLISVLMPVYNPAETA